MVSPTRWALWQNQLYKAARPGLSVLVGALAVHLNDLQSVRALWDWPWWDKQIAVLLVAILSSLVSAGQRFSRTA